MKINFLLDKSVARIFLELLLFVSVALNYIMWTDQKSIDIRFREIKHGIYDNIVDVYECNKEYRNEP